MRCYSISFSSQMSKQGIRNHHFWHRTAPIYKLCLKQKAPHLSKRYSTGSFYIVLALFIFLSSWPLPNLFLPLLVLCYPQLTLEGGKKGYFFNKCKLFWALYTVLCWAMWTKDKWGQFCSSSRMATCFGVFQGKLPRARVPGHSVPKAL